MSESVPKLQAPGSARNPEISALVDRLRAGEVRALARTISLVENNAPAAEAVLAECFPYAGSSLRIGITGAPGAGKSTLVDQLTRIFRRESKTVGVVAVDPTSPYTGGAILGDRIRMQEHHGDAGFYARSMATRGALGGLARTTADVASLVAASGKDVVMIETVGVGQDEVDIVRLADITLVVLVPGMGDDVQSIKAGIMEIADIFVINKCDREGADRLEKEIKTMQGLASRHGDWIPPVMRTAANSGEGMAALAARISEFEGWLVADGRLQTRRTAQWRERIVEMMRYEVLREIQKHGMGAAELDALARKVAAGEENPYRCVRKWVSTRDRKQEQE